MGSDHIFFHSYRSVSVSGDTAVISNHGGSVYVFTRAGTIWSEQAILAVSGSRVVDISGDTIVVGTSSDTVEVFIRSGASWSIQATLVASDAVADDRFGASVAVDGNALVVGASGNDDDGNDSGSAYIFTRSGVSWSEQPKLTAMDAAPDDVFGDSVDIHGNKVVVGAPGNDDLSSGSGSAYTFIQTGTTWSEEAKLIASDAAAGITGRLGRSAAIYDDTVVIGAQGLLELGSPGGAYVFTRSGAATWSEQEKLIGPVDAYFGDSVAIFDDTILVGDPGPGDFIVPIEAYVFMRNGTTWNQQAILSPAEYLLSTGAFSLQYGVSVALSGTTAIVAEGGHRNQDGAAWVFDLSCEAIPYTLPNNQWRQISLPCDPGANNTVAAVFGDDGLGSYGTDWILWAYDPATNAYTDIDLSDALEQGKGYWIIQKTSSDKTLDMPENSITTQASQITDCLSTAKGCFEISLETQDAVVEWNMVGYPFASAQSLSNSRVVTESGTCASGCDLNTAGTEGVVNSQLWTYNGSSYTTVDTSGNFDPWTGYWAATLPSSHGLTPRLLVPR